MQVRLGQQVIPRGLLALAVPLGLPHAKERVLPQFVYMITRSRQGKGLAAHNVY